MSKLAQRLVLSVALGLLGWAQGYAALVGGEYFVDVDPGYGQGTAIAIAPGDSASAVFEVPTGPLAVGFHTLYARFKDGEGKWSLPEARMFYVSSAGVVAGGGVSPLVSGEYFVDTDPGYGQGTALAFAQGDSVRTAFEVPTSALAEGFHTLYTRFANGDGSWGLPEARMFYVSSAAVVAGGGVSPLVSGEYFVDTDPGYGQGAALVIGQGDTVRTAFEVPTASLDAGFHTLYTRFANGEGAWGLAEARMFYVSSAAVVAGGGVSPLVSGEYFVDTDPGSGQGTALAFAQGDTVRTAFEVPTSALPEGFHTLYTRFANGEGAWGLAEARMFYVSSAAVVAGGGVSPLARLEYFYDQDPGFGAGTSLPISQADSVEFNGDLDVGLGLGDHTITLRAQNAVGGWSLGKTVAFTVATEGPPILARPVANQALMPSAGPLALDLAALAVFTDPDNDPLNYTLTSSDSAVATVSNTGSTLRVTPLKTGGTTITIAADDGKGGAARDSFVVAVVEWAFGLEVAGSGGETATLVLGLAAGGTPGIDTGLGDEELKPVPPAATFDARFSIPGKYGTARNLQGTRPGEKVWQVQIQPGAAGWPMTLSWDRASFPQRGFLMLEDAETGGAQLAVDMQAQDRFEVNDPALARLQVRYQERVEYTLALPAGWSLVSLPLTPTAKAVTALFPDASVAYGYDQGYQEATAMAPCKGYWIDLTVGGTYTVEGISPQAECESALEGGWNLIGGPWPRISLGEIGQTPDSILNSVFGFAGGYQPATELAPGAGYWVELSGPGTLSLKDTGLAKPVAMQESHQGGRLWAETPGWRQEILLGAEPGRGAALPPVPPGGIPDLRVVVDGVETWKVPESLLLQDYLVQVRGPVARLGWEMPAGLEGRWQLLVDGRAVELAGDASLVLKGGEQVSLRWTGAGSVPQTYRLAQNYPNPFNPETAIQYELRQDGMVRLRVYDVSGQMVRELAQGWQPRGRHQVIWDGRNAGGAQVASGVYFCELQAGDFRGLRKMVLMK